MFEEGYKVKPLSIKMIRQQTEFVRDFFGIDPQKPFPVLQFIENIVPECIDGFTFSILENEKFDPEMFACYNPIENQLQSRLSVYKKAFDGDGASRGHLCHELGHIFLHRTQGAVLARGHVGSGWHAKYEDSEWQATTFERELLIPFAQLTTTMSIDDIAEKYKTSTVLAEVAYDRYHRAF